MSEQMMSTPADAPMVSEETTPVSEETTPVSEETTPVSEETTPVSEETTPVSEETTPVSEESASSNDNSSSQSSSQQVSPDGQVNLLTVPINNENDALNVLIGFLSVAQRRGVFAINEAAKIFECVKKFHR